jgi:hypothetical protein
MHVALLANQAWLDEELTPFQHLVVGLIDEQVRVAQVVPERVSVDDLSVFGERVPWRESRVPALNRMRVAQLDEPLGALGVDLIHALDGRMWQGGLKLAEALGVPIILGACSMLDIRLAQRLLPRADPARVAVTAATEPIARALREHAGPEMLVKTIGTGVHGQDAQPPTLLDGQELCAIVSGNGVWDGDYDALLGGIASYVERRPMSQFFFDGQGGGQHQIWKAASAMGLLGNISLTPRKLGHREMLLRAHAMIHPQALGKSRSLTLRAMARGLPIIARSDPYLDYLIHRETAVVLDDPTSADWAGELDRLTTDPASTGALGRSAMRWVRQNRPTSHQIGGVLDIYRRMAGQTLPFPA